LSFAETSDRVSTVLGMCKRSSEKQVQREKHCGRTIKIRNNRVIAYMLKISLLTNRCTEMANFVSSPRKT